MNSYSSQNETSTQSRKSSASPLRTTLIVTAGLITIALLVTLYDAKKERIRGDFTRFTLAASRVMYAGGNPYSIDEVGQNYKYFPINAVLLGLFTLLPIPLAQGFWFALNTGLLLWCYREHKFSVHPLNIPWWVWCIALVLSFRYTWANLKIGQWNTSVYCLAFIGWSLTRRRPWIGGCLIGLSAALKFLPGFLILYFLAKRQWRAVTAVTLSIVLWILVIPSLILGLSRHIELLELYKDKGTKSYSVMRGTDYAVGYSLRATLYGYLHPAVRVGGPRIEREFNILNLKSEVANTIVDGLMVLLVIALFIMSLMLGRSKDHQNGIASLSSLMEIGLWFLLFLAISPEVRRAHLLTTFTPAFALALGAATTAVPLRTRILTIVSLAFAFFFMIVPSTLIKGSTYNEIACVYGSYTFSFLFLALGTFFFLMRSDLRQLDTVFKIKRS